MVRDEGGYATALQQTYQTTPALQPSMPFIDSKAPKKVRSLKAIWMPDGYYLFWTAPKGKSEMDKAKQYVVYRFRSKHEAKNLNDPRHIVGITRQNFIKLPYEDGRTPYCYVVTALDRLQNESKAATKRVKL